MQQQVPQWNGANVPLMENTTKEEQEGLEKDGNEENTTADPIPPQIHFDWLRFWKNDPT